MEIITQSGKNANNDDGFSYKKFIIKNQVIILFFSILFFLHPIYIYDLFHHS